MTNPIPFGTIELEVRVVNSEFRYPTLLAYALRLAASKHGGEIKFYEANGQGDWMIGNCVKTGIVALGPALYAATLQVLDGMDDVSNQEVSIGEMN